MTMIRFETENYHGEIREDNTWGWCEHIELGEDGGTGNFRIDINDVYWAVVDMNYCYDLPSEVYELLEDRIKVPQMQF